VCVCLPTGPDLQLTQKALLQDIICFCCSIWVLQGRKTLRIYFPVCRFLSSSPVSPRKTLLPVWLSSWWSGREAGREGGFLLQIDGTRNSRNKRKTTTTTTTMRSLTKNMQASLMNLLPRLSSSVPCPGRRKWVLTAAAAASSSSSFHLLPFHRCDASPSSSSCSCSSSPAASFYLWTKTNQRPQDLKLLELKIHNSRAINIRRSNKKK